MVFQLEKIRITACFLCGIKTTLSFIFVNKLKHLPFIKAVNELCLIKNYRGFLTIKMSLVKKAFSLNFNVCK
jgi:hypothetical protein